MFIFRIWLPELPNNDFEILDELVIFA